MLLEFNECGIYCPPGRFYIDPWKPVDDAVITHAHSDHAKWGHRRYLAHHLSAEVLRLRLGPLTLQVVDYGEVVVKNGVRISLHPAGHIVGSAQVRVEYKGEVWVVSGDYKLENDGISSPFEPVKCHSFISECTFGMPVFQWKDQQHIYAEINQWWARNAGEGKASVIAGYSLGKAQRILQHVDPSIGTIFTHGAVENVNEALRRSGVPLRDTVRVNYELDKALMRTGLIICPPSALGSPWLKKFYPYSLGYCSGWMNIRGTKRRSAVDRGFVMSDHADWNALLEAIKATECESVYLTHGYTAVFARYLAESGLDAHEATTLYGGEEEEQSEGLPDEQMETADEIPAAGKEVE